MLTTIYSCIFTSVYLLLLVLPYVYLFLRIFSHVYSCLPMFTLVYLCLPMFTRVYLFSRVDICDPPCEMVPRGAKLNYSVLFRKVHLQVLC